MLIGRHSKQGLLAIAKTRRRGLIPFHPIYDNTTNHLRTSNPLSQRSSQTQFIRSIQTQNNNETSVKQPSSPQQQQQQQQQKKGKGKDLSPLLITGVIIIIYVLKKRNEQESTPTVYIPPTDEDKGVKKGTHPLEKPKTFENENEPVRIAVIGAGISGSSTAYYTTHLLNNVLKQKVDVTVYEASDHVGGRLLSTTIRGVPCEVGGSHIIKDNYYAMRLLNGLGLHLGPDRRQITIVWDGDEEKPCFTEDPNDSWKNMKEYFKRYQFGWAVMRTKQLVKDLFLRFRKIYEMQQSEKFFVSNECFNENQVMSTEDLKKVFTWETVDQFIDAVHILQETRHSFYDHYCGKALPLLGIQERFMKEILEPLLRINYLQNVTELSAFAGGVAAAGVFSDFRPVKETTAAIVNAMLQDVKPSVRLNNRVTAIEQVPGSDRMIVTYTVQSIEDGKPVLKEEKAEYDYVVLASPLEFSEKPITFKGVETPESLNIKRSYQQVHTTFVVGELNLDYFHVQDQRKPIEQPKFYDQIAIDSEKVSEEEAGVSQVEYGVMTLRPKQKEQLEFNSISPVGKTKDTNEPIYKIFSTQAISDKTLAELFKKVQYTERHFWKNGAYPKLNPVTNDQQLSPIKISNHLFYANAFESITSTMETSLINSKNIAFMIGKDVLNRLEQMAQERARLEKMQQDEKEGYTE